MQPMFYTHPIPKAASFKDKGLSGYSFGPLGQKDLEIYYIESEKGHDAFIVSKRINRTYFVLSGSGYFTVNNERYPVKTGDLVEVPAKVEYSYSGRMNLLCISIPRWSNGNDVFIRWNADVFGCESRCGADNLSWYKGLAGVQIFGKSPVNAYLRLNQWLWNRLPVNIINLHLMQSHGRILHKLVCAQGRRTQFPHTFFLRNRPELELIRRLVDRKQKGETINVTVFGCSTGAEAYSIAWTIRSARPDLRLQLYAIDISAPAVEFAERGVYSQAPSELIRGNIFERMTPTEMDEFFEQNGDVKVVKPWLREGIDWRVGDAGEREMMDTLGPQDLVVANNFLCHMEAPEAERCLRNIARLVRPDGFLFVSGIDLDVRTRVSDDSGWAPVEDLVEEIHEGDPSVREIWPWHYSGLEPLDKRRQNWKSRYTGAFQLRSFKKDGRGRSPNTESNPDNRSLQNAEK